MFAYVRKYGDMPCACWVMIEPRVEAGYDDRLDIVAAVGKHLPCNFDSDGDPFGFLEPDNECDDFTIYPETNKRVPVDALIAEAMKHALTKGRD